MAGRRKRDKQHLLAYELTDDHKAEYVQLIYDGYGVDEAAEAIGSTGTQLRKFRSRKSQYHDPRFAELVDDAITSDEHQRNWDERVDGVRDQLLFEDRNATILQKELIRRGRYEKHPNFIQVNVEIENQVWADLAKICRTTEELDLLIELRERFENVRRDIDHAPLRALPAAKS